MWRLSSCLTILLFHALLFKRNYILVIYPRISELPYLWPLRVCFPGFQKCTVRLTIGNMSNISLTLWLSKQFFLSYSIDIPSEPLANEYSDTKLKEFLALSATVRKRHAKLCNGSKNCNSENLII